MSNAQRKPTGASTKFSRTQVAACPPVKGFSKPTYTCSAVTPPLQAELNSRLVPGAIAAQLFNELIVYAQDQEGGRPLADEQ